MEQKKAEEARSPEPQAAPDDEYLIDLDAFAPERHRGSKSFVKYGGKKYAVRAFLDLSYEEVMEVLELEAAVQGQNYVQQLKLARRQVEILVPKMAKETINKLTGRQIIRVALESLGHAEVPKKGNESESDSGT